MTLPDHDTHAHSLAEAERWLAFGAGLLVFSYGLSRRSMSGVGLAAASAPLLYRGLAGEWPAGMRVLPPDDPRTALGGDAGVHVRESVRLERPVEEVYRYWRRLEHLPRFMRYLERVTEMDDGRSRWVAQGPGGLRVQWDAEIINDVEDEVIAWQSLPGADVVTAGAVNFRPVRGGRSTQVDVHLQYAPPAGKAGAFIARLFGREPSQTVREDLRRLKQVLEAGELARTTSGAKEFQS